jgi:hypothetical protein
MEIRGQTAWAWTSLGIEKEIAWQNGKVGARTAEEILRVVLTVPLVPFQESMFAKKVRVEIGKAIIMRETCKEEWVWTVLEMGVWRKDEMRFDMVEIEEVQKIEGEV